MEREKEMRRGGEGEVSEQLRDYMTEGTLCGGRTEGHKDLGEASILEANGLVWLTRHV